MRFELKKLSYAALGAGVLSLAACGGGGGGSSPAAVVSNGAISGVASKGLMVGAKVTAYCGVQPTTAIGSATTDAVGAYVLTLSQACAKPIEVVVSAVAGTTMLDEIKGSITLPSGFSMRAFVPASNGGATITQQVTPLTDMAASLVEDAVTANTPLSAAVVGNANSAIISTVLGGNAALFTAVPLAPSHFSDSTTTLEQKQLITLLSSISAAASTLSTGSDGGNVQAILAKLVQQAKATIPAVTATSYSLSPSADPSGSGNTPLATIQTGLSAITSGAATVTGSTAIADAIKSNVALVQTAVVDSAAAQVTQGVAGGGTVTPVTVGTTLSAAIASTKLLISSFRNNVLGLVDPSQQGFLQTKATAINADFNGLALAGTYNVADVIKASQRATALLVETDRYLAAVAAGAGATPVNATLGSDTFGAYLQRRFSEGPGNDWNCIAYYSATGTLTAADGSTRTSPVANNNDNPVSTCSHFIYGDGMSQMQFQVKSPVAKGTLTSNSNFAYVNRIRKWADPACTSATNAACAFTILPNSGAGSLTATWDANAVLTGVDVVTGGTVLPYLGTTPASLALTYTLASVTDANAITTDTLNFNGGLSDGALSYGFKPGSKLVVSGTTTNGVTTGTAANFTLIGQIQTAAFQYNGTISADGTNASGVNGTSGTLGFTGSIATMANGVATKFLEGSMTGTGNSATSNNQVTFSGKVTDGGKVNDITITADASVVGQQSLLLTYVFPGYSITASGTIYTDVTQTSTATLSSLDGTTVVFTRVNGVDTGVVNNATGTKIGDLAAGNTINFVDGSYIVLN